MSHQCLICQRWFHYVQDHPVCRLCYSNYKEWEYDQPSHYGEDE